MKKYFFILSVIFFLYQKTAKTELKETLNKVCILDEVSLKDLEEKKKQLLKKEEELSLKELELDSRALAINEDLKKMILIKDEISRAKLLKNDEIKLKKNKLVETFLRMNPKIVAKIFSKLEANFSVEILTQMDSERLAKILNYLNPERAALLSELIGGIIHVENQQIGDDKNFRKSKRTSSSNFRG